MIQLARLFLACLTILISVNSTGAHSGGLDKNGGHFNQKTGEYHYHGQKTDSTPLSAAEQGQQKFFDIPGTLSNHKHQQTTRLSPSEKEAKLYAYFRAANENVGAFDCGQVKNERKVNQAVKGSIIRRDGYRCVICGSTVKLEVDHCRALMNGGTNDENNLATLCDDCHTAKTRLDNSLRRKREKMCRGR